jgi:aryl-alcohol dehydrogenase-like predicted oxidoreductase
MLARRVGSSGLHVSRLGLGTMTWGRDTSPQQARTLLRRFHEAGGTLVDTAPAYGNGAAEATIGKLVHTDLRRDDLVIATKGGFGQHDGRRVVDTSKRAMLADLAGSLRRLHTDHVDLWQVHAWSDDVPVDETLSALDLAVSTGRARYVGISNYSGWQTARAATHQLAFPGRAGLASTQVEYSLLQRGVEREVVPAAIALGLGILPWAPLGRGVLTGKYRTGTPADSRAASPAFERYVGTHLTPRATQIVEAVWRAAEGLELTPTEVALAWVRDQPGVTAPIVGARTEAQLLATLRAEDVQLPDEIRDALDDVSSPPTGYPDA